MRTLALIDSAGRRDPVEIRRMEAADLHPRVLLFEDRLGAQMLDRSYLRTLPRTRRRLAKLLPGPFAQVVAAYGMRGGYEVVISWGERLTLMFALLLKLTGSRTRHIALMYWISPPKKALLLRALQSRVDHIITWSSVQRDFAIERLRIPPSKITLISHWVDQRFWRPMQAEPDMICAVGNEMRDYPTLIEALRGLPIRCHIAAHDRLRRRSGKVTTAPAIVERAGLPRNVTVGAKSYAELRDLYARARFVVCPLRPTDSDNGITSILESMAMGKAVICSRVRGQVDVIRDGVTGIFVPPGDAGALREAILYLWGHPEIADQMGAQGRKVVEERHTFDQFVERVRQIVATVPPPLAGEGREGVPA